MPDTNKPSKPEHPKTKSVCKPGRGTAEDPICYHPNCTVCIYKTPAWNLADTPEYRALLAKTNAEFVPKKK